MQDKKPMIYAEEAVQDREVLLSDLPDIDLYMDQIITLIEEKLAPGSSGKSERPLTKTMINNYSKEGLIKPVKGKKYTKEHIVQMLMIYSLKNTLSIQEIKRLFAGVYGENEFGSKDLLKSYGDFLATKPLLRNKSLALLDEIIEVTDCDIEDPRDTLSLVIELAAISAYLKSISQAVLRDRFASLPTNGKSKSGINEGGKNKKSSRSKEGK
jgi:DNA-binding transcriptional MerR regulator